jgi:hypothetical protein
MYFGLLMLLIILLIIVIILNMNQNGDEDEEIKNIKQIKHYVNNLPVRSSLQINDPIEEYRKKHPVIVSLTTSPKRISKIKHVFDTLDLDNIDYIVLALPLKYGRDQSEYIIPEELKNFPKLKILRIEKDLGPITKLIPAVEYARYELKDDDAIIITIDDDTAYPKGMIKELLLNVILNENTVVSGSGQNLNYWNIHSIFPQTDKNNGINIYTQNQDKYIDVIEGFAGIAYKSKYVDIELMTYLTKYKQCFVSDDIVISFVLAFSGVNRLKINNPYFSVEKIKQYGYGFENDALHRGAGLDNQETIYKFNDENHNYEKYRKCYKNLLDLTVDYSNIVSKFKKRQDILQ